MKMRRRRLLMKMMVSHDTQQTGLQLQDGDVEQQGHISLGTRFSVPVSQLNFG